MPSRALVSARAYQSSHSTKTVVCATLSRQGEASQVNVLVRFKTTIKYYLRFTKKLASLLNQEDICVLQYMPRIVSMTEKNKQTQKS